MVEIVEPAASLGIDVEIGGDSEKETCIII